MMGAPSNTKDGGTHRPVKSGESFRLPGPKGPQHPGPRTCVTSAPRYKHGRTYAEHPQCFQRWRLG